MKSKKLKEVNSTASIVMQEISKATGTVLNTTNTSMTTSSSKRIGFSISKILTDFNSYISYKLRFRQVNSNNEVVTVKKANSSYIVSEVSYPTIVVLENGITYREVDLTNAINESGGGTTYYVLECESTDGLQLYTNNATAEYKPKLEEKYIEDGDFIKDQVCVSGSSKSTDQYEVNVRNGKLNYSMFLFENNQIHQGTNLALNYCPHNVISSLVNGFPIGWKLNYYQFITAVTDGYLYYDDMYKKHKFVLAENLTSTSENKIYYEEEGNYLTMQVNEDSTTQRYIITNLKHDSLTFNSSGLLVKISEKVDDNITYNTLLEYDSSHRLIKITDGGGKITTLSYSSTTVVITKPDGKYVFLRINSSTNCLTQVEDNVCTTTFTYQVGEGLVKPNGSVINVPYKLNCISSFGKKVTFEYTSTNGKKIYKVTESSKNEDDTYKTDFLYKIDFYGNKSKLTYNPNSIYQNNGSLYHMYHFNEQGEVYKEEELSSANEVIFIKETKKTQFSKCTMKSGHEGTPYLAEAQVIAFSEEFSIIDAQLTTENNNLYKAKYYFIIDYFLTKLQSLSTLSTDQIIVEIYDNDGMIARKILSYKDLDSKKCFVDFETKYNVVGVYITNEVSNTALTIKKLDLYKGAMDNSQLLSNIENGSSQINIDNVNYYNAEEIKIGYKVNGVDTLLDDEDYITLQDIQVNKEISFYADIEYASLVNLWCNNGQKMYGLVSNPFLQVNNTNKNIKFFEYLVYSGNSDAYQYTSSKFDYSNFRKVLINKSFSKKYSNSLVYQKSEYDQYGKLLQSIDEKGTKQIYTYQNGEVVNVTVSYENNDTTELKIVNNYTYNNNRLESEFSSCGTNTIGNKYQYIDSSGQLEKVYDINDTQIALIENTYSSVDKRLSEVDFNYKYVNEYNIEKNSTILRGFNYSDENISLITEGSTYNYEYSYNKDGTVKQISLNNKVLVSFDYSYVDGCFTKTTSYIYGKTPNDDNSNIEQERLTYDKHGNLQKVERKKVGETSFTVHIMYEYQTLGVNGKDVVTLDSKLENIYSEYYDENEKVYYASLKYNENEKLREYDGPQFKTAYTYGTRETSKLDGYAILYTTTKSSTLITDSEPYKIEYVDDYKNNNNFTKALYKGIQFVNEGITCQYYTLNDKLNRKIENVTGLLNNIYYDNFSYHDAGDNTTNFVETQTFSTSTNEANSSVDKGTITYLYNNMGHISSISYDSVTNTYDYDSHGRIVKEVNNQFGKKFIYSYDSKGNLSSKKTYLLANNTLSETKNYDDPYELDNFYPTTINGKSVSFEFGKLVSYDNVTFTYDILGNRRSKGTSNNNTTTYLYEDGKLIIQRNPDGTELEFIYGDSSIIGFKHKTSNETKLYYFRKNILGDVIELYYNGSVVAKYVYDAWGNHKVYSPLGLENTLAGFIGNINPIRYRGYYYDVETQLFYCNSRYYSPELCRFISPDSIEYLDPQSINGLNLYCYCMNNPIMYTDPSGHFVITLSAVLAAAAIGAAIGAVSGAVYGGITAAANGQNVWAGIGIGALTGGFMGAGAGIASLFIAPVLVGEGVMVATATGAGFVMGNALSAGAALAIGTGIAFGTGFVGGTVADASTQVVNDGGVNDWGSVFVSGIQWGLINTAGAFLGSMGGTSTLNGALLSAIFGGVTGAVGMTIDILRNRKNQKQKVSVNNQLYAYCF